MILTLGYIFIHVQPIFPTILFIKEPLNVRYWPIRFKNLYSNCVPLEYFFVILGALLDILASIFAVFPTGFIVAMLIIYFAKLKLWLMKINQMINIWGPSENTLRKFKIIAILNQFGFSCLSAEILPALYTVGYVFSTVTLAALFKRSAGMPFEVQLNCSGALIIIFITMNSVINVAGDIVTTSQDTKRAFIKAPKKDIKKSMGACRDIRIYFNSVFFMEKGTYTVFVHCVINNTITFILAT